MSAYRRFILFFVLLSCCTIAQAQVSITSVTPTTVCVGSSITVSFTNSDSEQASFSLYLYPLHSTDSLAINQATYISGDGLLYGLIPANQPSGSYRVGIKKVVSNGVFSITKSDSFSINAIPSAPTVASNPVIYCMGSRPYPLTVIVTSGGSLYWYSSPAGGIGISSPPTPSTMIPGSTTYYVSQVINGCEGPRSSISVVVKATPPPPTITASVLYICQGVQVPPLSASGSNLNWYTSANGGTGSTSITPTTAQPGVFVYFVSQTVDGCESPRAAITVFVAPTPSTPSVNSVTYCQGSSAITLVVRANYGSTLNWYTMPTGGLALPSIIPSTANVGTTTFYVSQVVNGCESPRAALTVTVTPKPIVSITADEITLTPNRTSILLTATTSTSSLTWSTGDTTAAITIKDPGDYSLTSKDGNGCSATGNVIIDQSPVEVLFSLKAGAWTDPSIWSTNQVPTNAYAVRLHHFITVPADYQAQAFALRYRPGGQLQLNSGSYLKIGL